MMKSIASEQPEYSNPQNEPFDPTNLKRSRGITTSNKPAFELSDSKKTLKDDLISWRSGFEINDSPKKQDSETLIMHPTSNETSKIFHSPKSFHSPKVKSSLSNYLTVLQ